MQPHRFQKYPRIEYVASSCRYIANPFHISCRSPHRSTDPPREDGRNIFFYSVYLHSPTNPNPSQPTSFNDDLLVAETCNDQSTFVNDSILAHYNDTKLYIRAEEQTENSTLAKIVFDGVRLDRGTTYEFCYRTWDGPYATIPNYIITWNTFDTFKVVGPNRVFVGGMEEGMGSAPYSDFSMAEFPFTTPTIYAGPPGMYLNVEGSLLNNEFMLSNGLGVEEQPFTGSFAPGAVPKVMFILRSWLGPNDNFTSLTCNDAIEKLYYDRLPDPVVCVNGTGPNNTLCGEEFMADYLAQQAALRNASTTDLLGGENATELPSIDTSSFFLFVSPITNTGPLRMFFSSADVEDLEFANATNIVLMNQQLTLASYYQVCWQLTDGHWWDVRLADGNGLAIIGPVSHMINRPVSSTVSAQCMLSQCLNLW